MKVEEKWYEASPYVYMLLGFGILIFLPGGVATFCGLALAVAGFSILRMRQAYRRKAEQSAQPVPPAPDRRD